MGGDSKKKKTKKKRVLAENTVGADDAPDAPKKPRTEVPPAAAAETATTLTKDQQTLADKWRERKENAKDGDVEAFALKPKKTEVQAVAYVTRALKPKKEADRKAQYDMFGLTYFEAPPLPDGATEADLERLEDEDLEAMYGC